MAKKGIKIKDLAAELGVTSRELINRCREDGLDVQNSITKLAPEAERRARGLLDRGDEDEAAEEAGS